MVTPEGSKPSPMSKQGFGRYKPSSSSSSSSSYSSSSSSILCLKDRYLYIGGSLFALLTVIFLWHSYAVPSLTPSSDPETLVESHPETFNQPAVNLRYDPPDKTFYDDPELSYSIENPIKNWDEKRKEWLKLHPSFLPGSRDRIVMVTGSQPKPCKSPRGDHFLLRLFKNKVDYCRIHGFDIFYDNVLLHPKMNSYWAKYPVVKAAMLAHPEAEWIWWVDSDAVITDMEFKHPLKRYEGFNLVVHGWETAIFKDKSWTGLNAGVFLIRNCQWSLDFMDGWANMGPIGKEYRKWGPIQKSIFKDKMFPESDDQTSLIYLLYKNPKLLKDKVYLEGEYYFEGYWIGMVPKLDNATERYTEIERRDPRLRRRHAEKVSEQYGAFREPFLRKGGVLEENWRRPFVTHFTGCQPCSGDHNPMYKGDSCWDGMIKALNFADNQVLRNYGFVKPDLLDSETVVETQFDYPVEEGPFG